MRKRKYLSVLLAMVLALTMMLPVTAAPRVKRITITGKKTVYVGDIIELDSHVLPGYIEISDYNIQWRSSNTKVAKVLRHRDEDTKIKGIKPGKAKITVKIRGTKIKATYKITVKKAKKSKSAVTKAKKTIKKYKNNAKSVRADIKKTKLSATATGRRSQYYAFERKINNIENKLSRMDDKWEMKYEMGNTSYKSYRTIEREVEKVEYYLETVEDYLNQKFSYEFGD